MATVSTYTVRTRNEEVNEILAIANGLGNTAGRLEDSAFWRFVFGVCHEFLWLAVGWLVVFRLGFSIKDNVTGLHIVLDNYMYA